MVLQISKAYLDKSIETEEIKYATPEKKRVKVIIIIKWCIVGAKISECQVTNNKMQILLQFLDEIGS